MHMTATYDADLQLFINGAWRSGEGRDERPVYNPATAGTISELPVATAADLDAALAAAERGWPVWPARNPEARAALIHRDAGTLHERPAHIKTLHMRAPGTPMSQTPVDLMSCTRTLLVCN